MDGILSKMLVVLFAIAAAVAAAAELWLSFCSLDNNGDALNEDGLWIANAGGLKQYLFKCIYA